MGPTPAATDADSQSAEATDGTPGTSDGQQDLLSDAPPVRRRRKANKWERRREKAKKYAKWVVAGLVAIALILLLILWLILGRIDRIDAIEGNRPASAKGQTFLVLGLDRRSEVQTTGENAEADSFAPGEARADIIMLVHVADDREKGYAVSIPRDTWVDIPGHGEAKVNAAYSYGGAALMTKTVRNLTGLWIDHVAVVDFEGFRQFTDAVGGVDVFFSEPVAIPGYGAWPQGVVHLDGELALSYVRQRYGLPGGDFDRIQRQQNFIRQLGAKVVDEGVLTNPARVKAMLDHLAANVTVDDTFGNFEMLKFGWSMRSFDTGNLAFYTVPNDGTGWAGDQSIVVYDAKDAAVMWEAFGDENVELLERRFGDLALTGAVN
ncbi:MAG TPA: LCP family protein [Nocardioidaceae bacterium]|nr:LCP family protein [Nocardioidaceae bacterium]